MEANLELADFLRSRRTRLRTGGVALAAHRRRRTPGLRREEVAQRAGISVEWYVEARTGPRGLPSDETLDALGRALELDTVERVHLRSLVGKAKNPPFRREAAPAPLRRLVECLSQPAYVTGQRWDLLAWNRAAVDIFGDFGRLPIQDRNILIFMLHQSGCPSPVRRRLGEGGPARGVAVPSGPRSWTGDDAFTEIVGRVQAGCP